MSMTKGFTLVETLVAIALVSIAIVAPFHAVQSALNASYTARDRMIAVSLAEEGLEYVRAIRDGNYLYNLTYPSTPRSWLYGLDGTDSTVNCITANGCTVDPTQNTVAACSSGGCTPLNLSSTRLYNQASQTATNVPTRFTRKVVLASVSATEVVITVTVSWTTHGASYTTTVTDTFRNWL